jgi:hypothetical protein
LPPVLPPRALIAEAGPVSERLRVREIDDDEGQRLVRIVRRGSGSVVNWRRAQMVLLSAQGMDATLISKVAFTSEDRGRDVIRNFNADGFSSPYPKYKGGRPLDRDPRTPHLLRHNRPAITVRLRFIRAARANCGG